MLLLIIFISSLSSIHQADALCTFPSDLTGVWESPTKGNLTFNSSYVEGYQIWTGTQYTEMTFECHLNSDSYYVIRSQNFTVLGGINVVNAITCMDLTQQSSTKFTYYLKTTFLNDAKFERVMFIAHDQSVSVSDICNETVATHEVHLLISYGTGVSGATQCPNAILGVYYYLNHGTCTSSLWDVCSDLTKMQFNYTLCSDIMAYTISGEVYCQYYVYSGNTAIFYVYNTDTSVNNSVNYQFTCLMAEIDSSGNVYTSMYPLECLPNMTTTYVASGGKLQQLGVNYTCVPTNDSAEEAANAGLIAGLVILFLVLIVAGVIGGYFLFKKKFKKVSPNVIDKEKSNLSTSRSVDPVTPSVVDPEIKSPPNGGSHGKKHHKRIAIKKVEKRSVFTPPADTKPLVRYKRLNKNDMTLITPRTLKPITSPRQPPTIETPLPPTSHRPRTSIDHAPKVTPAPIEMRLELPNDFTRESTTISVISRATTVNEDNIALKLLSEKSMLEEKTKEKVKIKSGRSISNKSSAGGLIPSSRRNQRNITLSVKPLNKRTTAPKSKRTRFNVEFKDTTGVYRRKKVKLVGKRQTPKKVKLDNINFNSVTSDTNEQRPLSKESMYGFDLVKELNRPKNQLKLKNPEKVNKSEDKAKDQTFQTNIGPVTDDGDDNFFMCSNHEEDVLEANNLTDSMKINNVQEEVKDVKSIVVLNEKQDKKETKTKTKKKRPTKWNFVHEIERVAKTSFVKKKLATSETNMLIKAKKEAVIEQKVLTKIYYNYDFKTKSKIKQRKRRNKRRVDLTKMTNFTRIPTLINWVEYTDILQTPAMAMQKQINKSNHAKNGEKTSEGEIANQKYTL